MRRRRAPREILDLRSSRRPATEYRREARRDRCARRRQSPRRLSARAQERRRRWLGEAPRRSPGNRSERWDRPAADRRAPARSRKDRYRGPRPPSANSGAETELSPRICRLPRALISMMPLPCARAASQSPMNASSGIGPAGNEPREQPVARLHGGRQAGAGAAGEGLAHSAASAWMPRSSPRRDRCGADAKVPCAARPRAVRR